MFEEMTFSAFESRFRDKTYIGSGGFGKVYKVFDHAKNHYVALKVADVRPEWKKFTLQNEVALVNSLPTHRNIARYDACYRFNTGLAGEMDFAILKFYEYGNLEQFISKQKLLPEDKKLIIRGMLDGLDFLHRHNVIHRDLKAQNILLHREDGIWTPKIIDFGLSRQIGGDSTITNSAIGLSYAYAAPEQIQNKKIYKNVDLWAAGVIIYRIIADELPFKGRDGGDEKSTQSQLELSRKIIQLELPDKLEQLPEPYRGMIKRCLVLDPAERIQTAHELIVLLNDNQVPTFGTSFLPPPPIRLPPSSRRRLLPPCPPSPPRRSRPPPWPRTPKRRKPPRSSPSGRTTPRPL
ncbi:MAG: serine/threonine-protein kinase [Bacteroidota bacterium]